MNLSAPDLAAYIASQRPAYVPAPPGMTDADFVAHVERANPGVTVPAGSKQENFAAANVISGSYEELSYCSWLNEWLVANEKGAISRRDRATQVLVAASHWPTIGQAGDLANLQVGYSKGAQDGDSGVVQEAYNMYNCDFWSSK